MGTVALSLKVINWDKLIEIFSLYFLNQLVFFGNIEVDFLLVLSWETVT